MYTDSHINHKIKASLLLSFGGLGGEEWGTRKGKRCYDYLKTLNTHTFK